MPVMSRISYRMHCRPHALAASLRAGARVRSPRRSSRPSLGAGRGRALDGLYDAVVERVALLKRLVQRDLAWPRARARSAARKKGSRGACAARERTQLAAHGRLRQLHHRVPARHGESAHQLSGLARRPGALAHPEGSAHGVLHAVGRELGVDDLDVQHAVDHQAHVVLGDGACAARAGSGAPARPPASARSSAARDRPQRAPWLATGIASSLSVCT